MGNTNQAGRGTKKAVDPSKALQKKRSGDLGAAAMKGWPILFHQVHSENIQLSLDRRRAKRIESFCKGICFGNRPVAVNERIYLKFAEVSTSWSGVVRFGFTSHDPVTVNPSELPRYACPDLTNKPGYWAKALPERYANSANILFYYVTRNGDVMFGINGEEKGVFFSGVNTGSSLWALVDIYGNTTAMEFVDGRQLNNLSPTTGIAPGGAIGQDMTQAISSLSLNSAGTPVSKPGVYGGSSPHTTNSGQQSLGGNIPVRHHAHLTFTPLPFHNMMGRNVCLSSDRTIAVRLVEEYCNGYVFTSRPLFCGEKLVIQILAVDKAFCGGLAFGLTACDPVTLNAEELPDDADSLLDRPEYWIVNKDVCPNAEVGDELSFHLTENGEIRYGKNGHHVVILMHVDKTLPLWIFFDVYGSTQKIKSLGIASRGPPPPVPQHRGSLPGGGLTVALPPPRSQPATPTTTASPPPRPPPPRSSPSPRRNSQPQTPPSLPPKQNRPLPAQPPPPGSILTPTPVNNPNQNPNNLPSPLQPITPPAAPPRNILAAPLPVTHTPNRPTPALPMDMSEEAADNASNECAVCLEKAVDCVLYTCGHMCCCYECALDIKASGAALCPICRQDIKDVIKIYRA